MNTVTQLRPRAALRMAPPPPATAGMDTDEGVFWCGALGSALQVAEELAGHLDIMSASIGRLPQRTGLTRPAVAAYLNNVRSLAESWRARLRPSLAEAAGALASAGAAICRPATRKGSAARASVPSAPLPPALARRMTRALSLLQGLSAQFDHALDQVARSSTELDTDTMQLVQLLQADQVHALMLSQQASTLQSKLDDATMRQHAYWLLGPHAEQIRQEIAMHSSAREGVRRQLDHLRAEQAATQAESRYIEQLLPSLSSYLAGMDRLGAALRAMLGGSRALLDGWRALRTDSARRDQVESDSGVTPQLLAATPHWEALAASAERLRRPAPHYRITTPDGYRT